MIIALDVGNTNTKIGIFDGDELVESLRLSSSMSKTGDEYGFYLVGMLKNKGITPDDIDGGIISSVNPNLNYTFEHMLDYYL
ncbi:MAG: type III pantothenate kinase, partial [Clostridiales bacterium]|nr:type III pantothenate kinase [Clostridiales bacterium]